MSDRPDFMISPCEHGDDAAAYALGALDPHELVAFRRHLSTCAICQEEVTSLEHLSHTLGMAAPQHPASRQLRKNVMRAVRDDAVERARTAKRSSRMETAGAGLSWLSPTRSFGGGRGVARPGLVGLAAAVALVLVVVVVGIAAGGHRSTTNGSGSRVYQASIGSAEVVVAANGRAQLIVHKLAQLDANHTYEVWFQRGRVVDPTPALFNVTAAGDDAVNLPGSLSGVSRVMVTKEPAGGRARPTPPVLVATALG